MRKTLIVAARSGVRAICGINTIGLKVIDEQGKPALGQGRLVSGVCGSPIRRAALTFVREAHNINQTEKLGLTLMGVGGITLPEHFKDFFEAGADSALTATGLMWDPYLAARYHEQ